MSTATLTSRTAAAPAGPAGQLRALARTLWQHASTPPARTPTDEAAEVRAMADRVRLSDPGFASDLYAAADRHERLSDAAR